jgi:hypothetical protein
MEKNIRETILWFFFHTFWGQGVTYHRQPPTANANAKTAAGLPNNSTTQRAQGPARRKALRALEANPQLNYYRWY